MSALRIMDSLKTGRLTSSPPFVFDDKSECSYKYTKPTIKEIKNKLRDPDFLDPRTPSEMKNRELTAEKLSRSPRKLKKLMRSSREETGRLLKDDLKKNFRVICFTKRPDNPLMWKQYADAYSGCVLEFNFSSLREIHEIKYSSNAPEWNLAKPYDSGKYFIEILTHKYPQYKWEEEWRYVTVKDVACLTAGPYIESDKFIPLLFREELKGVYIGNKIDRLHENGILSILNEERYKHVRIYKQRETVQDEGMQFQLLRNPELDE